ncbi:MAG: helix-turn-helix domain-containing protein [Spirulina sp. SIO3F2]|nr:helix-turn-helix domain-containing protein [Spirulina sp. SIO3F2]
MNIDYTARLRSRLTQKNIPSFRALARQAGVTDWSVRQLRSGKADQLRGGILIQLAQTLDYSLPELLQQFSAIPVADSALPQSETHRTAIAQSEPESSDETMFQKNTLDTLESWLRQWPTVVAAIAKNPNLPASRVVPLLQPLENLLNQWDVEAIASVGEVLPYDPQWHQLLNGMAQPGEQVRVRYVGYRHQDKLLFRAQVSPQD